MPHATPQHRPANRNGRPREKGGRLPTRAARAAAPVTCWQTVTVADGYGKGERTVAIVSETAVWYHTGLPPVPIRWVLIRDPQGQCATQALRDPDLRVAPELLIGSFVRRWQMEATFAEVRRHLGVARQRQGTDKAIRRTTPVLLGRFALVTLRAHPHLMQSPDPIRHAAWYHKRAPTFAEARAVVRREIRAQETSVSGEEREMVKVPRALRERFTETLCYVACLAKVELRSDGTLAVDMNLGRHMLVTGC